MRDQFFSGKFHSGERQRQKAVVVAQTNVHFLFYCNAIRISKEKVKIPDLISICKFKQAR